MDLDDVLLRVYSPQMIVAEKIRAICQQLPEYKSVVPSINGRPRPRDFFDIYNVSKSLSVDFENSEFHSIIKEVFTVKRVPLSYLDKIKSQREFHQSTFDSSVKISVPADFDLKSFDYYFEFVCANISKLEGLWKI